MTFREYWRVLGFGVLSTKARCFVDRANAMIHEVANNRSGDIIRVSQLQDRLDLAMTALEQERQARIELHEKLTDSLMTKAGLQKLNFKPGPPKESKPQALTALDEMELDYDRVQAEDREISQ